MIRMTGIEVYRLMFLPIIATHLAGVVLSLNARGDTIYASGGGKIEKFTSNGVGSVFANQVQGSLAVDNAGNVYVGTDQTILKFDPNGTSSVFATTTSGYEQEGLAIDSAGNIYLSLYAFTTNLIEKFTPAGVGSILAHVDPPGPLVVDPAGNVYVTVGGQANIEKITPSGVGSTFVDGSSNGLAGGFESIAGDSEGNVYALVYNGTADNAIVKYTRFGHGIVFATVSSGNGTLAVDSSGNVFYSDFGTIEKFTPSGVGSPFANFPAGAIAITSVPEPATLVLGGSGVTAPLLASFRRKGRDQILKKPTLNADPK